MLNTNAFAMVARQAMRSPSRNKFKSVHVFSFLYVFCSLGLFFDLCNCFKCPKIYGIVL